MSFSGRPYYSIGDEEWTSTREVTGIEYACGHCGKQVGPSRGYETSRGYYHVYICPACNQPTYMGEMGYQVPGPPFGRDLECLPQSIDVLYSEARRCMTVAGWTAMVLLGRKLLMHVAVTCGAKPGLKFVQYVDYLYENHRIPEGSRDWVDRIRTKGNVANHEIQDISREDATDLLTLVEALLYYAYEIPGRAQKASQTM